MKSMTDNLYTGEFYKVSKTGEIGEKIECHCDTPVLLEFSNGKRDAYHLRDVVRAERPRDHTRGRSEGEAVIKGLSAKQAKEM